ncbi:MAG TPA: SIS domain-containing protein [Acidimicrobiales bacterium]|jgi:glucosamine--fructose-6-phosphate aminotransferase (isomerizing)|nr:SIS domain-containing protein [Acidimicrobiales bacterium]
MCGIVAVLARPSSRAAAEPGDVLGAISEVTAELARLAPEGLAAGGPAPLTAAAERLRRIDADLRGPAGLRTLLGQASVLDGLDAALSSTGAAISAIEGALDSVAVSVAPAGQEEFNSALVRLKDAWWAVARDRMGMGRRVAALRAGRPLPPTANLDGWWAIGVALASLDRLEVRGRDSAGVHILVAGSRAWADDEEIERRSQDELFPSGSVRTSDGAVGFVYKAAAEIGELGDNVRSLSAAIAADGLLARVIEDQDARVSVVGHTRWASVGIISEANAHPVNSEELDGRPAPYVVAALNGDVDNHLDLRQEELLSLPTEVTTDAKVIPAIVGRRMSEEMDPTEAFLATVTRFEGSVAIASSAAAAPDQIHLALYGSGQSLYIGLADGAFVVASEPYGLVEETDRYVRMDGESTQGEMVVLERASAGEVGGLERRRYSGLTSEVTEADVVTAEITTRDVDRRGYDHFLLKEITEAPDSFRKTLRGRIASDADGRLAVRLGAETLPEGLTDAVADGSVRRVIVIGQGTAAVAGQAVASAVRHCLTGFSVHAMPATELSGFGLTDDMSDTLVIAISQSGTTTDTNRTVDLARTRGAHIVAVVNRRNSDLAAKAHGVLHTSDGRDVEMSVASTKAFYAQVAAGWLLAAGLAVRAGERSALDAERMDHILQSLRALPAAMEQILGQREEIGRIAASVAPPRRYWAVVGSGPDRIAASEVRIKLSELCYRSISADTTEDKKHIDLSCEPLILVCAAGLRGPNADDVAKEVAIYKAHKAAPIVIASAGEEDRFRVSARDVVTVPEVEPNVAFVLSAMVGHLFGYEAALSIDAQARTLRAVRAVLERATGHDPDRVLDRLRPALINAATPFLNGLRAGTYNGNLEAATAVCLAGLLNYATGALPLENYESETGKIGTPNALLTDLLDALSAAIDELTRPIDAIKHQAKTVTVGISRSEDALFGIPLVKATLAAGAAPDTLGYRALRTLGALDRAVDHVLGYTRYRVDWAPAAPTAVVIDQGGAAVGLRSRTERDPRLLGSKHRAADEREVTVVRGASDGRTVILVPEVKGQQVTGLTLLHVAFHDRLPAEDAAAVLSGYRTRFNALSDAVTETEPTFDVARLGDEPITDLLTEPVYALARRWRSA